MKTPQIKIAYRNIGGSSGDGVGDGVGGSEGEGVGIEVGEGDGLGDGVGVGMKISPYVKEGKLLNKPATVIFSQNAVI